MAENTRVLEIDNFIFLGEWLNSIQNLDVDTQDKIIGEIVRYGANKAFEHADEPMIAMAVNFTKGAIDKAKKDYYEKIVNGSKGGRKKTVDDKAVYELARQGKKSEEIAAELGVSKSSVDHSIGWTKRKEDFVF